MNAKSLLDSRKFCLLATDFAKTWLDKKASEDDKEMRLEAVLDNLGCLNAPPMPSELDIECRETYKALQRQIPLKVQPGTPIANEMVEQIGKNFGESFNRSIELGNAKPKRRYTKRAKPEATDTQAATKAELLAAMRAPLSAEETAALVAESKKGAKTDDQIQGEVNRAVAEVIKANWEKTPLTEGERHFHVKANRGGINVSFEPERWKNALKLAGLPHSKVTFRPEGLAMSSPTNSGGGLDTTQGANIWRVMIG